MRCARLCARRQLKPGLLLPPIGFCDDVQAFAELTRRPNHAVLLACCALGGVDAEEFFPALRVVAAPAVEFITESEGNFAVRESADALFYRGPLLRRQPQIQLVARLPSAGTRGNEALARKSGADL